MPTYVCRLGCLKEFALTEPGIFFVTDTKGREWYCREGTEEEWNFGLPRPTLIETQEGQERADRQGLCEENFIIVLLQTERDMLPTELGHQA
jgi:hypothetical protein